MTLKTCSRPQCGLFAMNRRTLLLSGGLSIILAIIALITYFIFSNNILQNWSYDKTRLPRRLLGSAREWAELASLARGPDEAGNPIECFVWKSLDGSAPEWDVLACWSASKSKLISLSVGIDERYLTEPKIDRGIDLMFDILKSFEMREIAEALKSQFQERKSKYGDRNRVDEKFFLSEQKAGCGLFIDPLTKYWEFRIELNFD